MIEKYWNLIISHYEVEHLNFIMNVGPWTELPELFIIWFMDPFPFKNTDIALKTFTPVLDGVKIPFVTATELSLKNE